MLIALRPPSAVFSLFRSHMLHAFTHWIRDSRPTKDEIASEIDATISAMRQIAEVA